MYTGIGGGASMPTYYHHITVVSILTYTIILERLDIYFISIYLYNE